MDDLKFSVFVDVIDINYSLYVLSLNIDFQTNLTWFPSITCFLFSLAIRLRDMTWYYNLNWYRDEFMQWIIISWWW